MAIKVEKLVRTFEFNGVTLPDPNPDFSVEEVRDAYVGTYPDLATAAVEGPKTTSTAQEYTFRRAVGAKG